MNKIVKILLLILAVILIAGGGFWSGTQVAYQQTAALPAQSSAPIASPTTIAPGSNGSNRPGINPQMNGDNMGPRGRFGGESSNTEPDQNNFNNRRDGMFARTPREMAEKNGANFGPQMMRRDFQSRPAAGLMMDQRNNTGNRGLSIGGMFMGGGMMLFGLLFPLGFAILMVLGIIVLYRIVRKPSVNPVVGTAVCAKCGGSIQNDWKHCPHCGELIG